MAPKRATAGAHDSGDRQHGNGKQSADTQITPNAQAEQFETKFKKKSAAWRGDRSN
jgi:hypothetical protein